MDVYGTRRGLSCADQSLNPGQILRRLRLGAWIWGQVLAVMRLSGLRLLGVITAFISWLYGRAGLTRFLITEMTDTNLSYHLVGVTRLFWQCQCVVGW